MWPSPHSKHNALPMAEHMLGVWRWLEDRLMAGGGTADFAWLGGVGCLWVADVSLAWRMMLCCCLSPVQPPLRGMRLGSKGAAALPSGVWHSWGSGAAEDTRVGAAMVTVL